MALPIQEKIGVAPIEDKMTKLAKVVWQCTKKATRGAS